MRDVGPDSLTKFRSGAADGNRSYFVERSANFRFSKDLVDGLIELRGYLGRRPPLGGKANPIGCHQIGKACLDHGGNVLQGSDTVWRSDRKGAQLACANQVDYGKRGDKHILNVAADQVG